MTWSRLTLYLSATLLFGCGDNKSQPEVPDGPPGGGGGGGSSDAQVDGRVIIESNYGSDEGGEVRLEYIRFANGTGTGARATAFFYKDPGTPAFWPFLDLNGCTDLSGPNSNGKWPKAQSANREYFDIGAYVNVSGGPNPFVIRRTSDTSVPPAPAKDPIGRTHPVGSWYFDPAAGTDTDGAQFLSADTYYDVTLPGSPTFPGKTYDNVLYMPGDWSIASPPFNTTAIPMTPGADKTYVFNNATNHPPTSADGTPVVIQNLIAFTGPNGPAVICVKPIEAGATTSVTVPASMVNVVRTAYATGGTVARQTVAHTVRSLIDETGQDLDRRIDFLGVWCYAGQPFSVP